jgi:histone H3/H4
MKGSLIVAANVKDAAKIEEKNLNVSEDFYRELENKVKEIVNKACVRAKANGRNTVMGKDV